MIKAIIFDINGVLITPETLAFDDIVKLDDTVDFEKKLKDFNSGKISAKSLWSNYLNGTRKRIRPLKDIMILLEDLKKNYSLYVISNSTNDGARKKLEDHGMLNYFNDIFTSFEIGHAKPDLQIFRHVLTAVNLNPEECLFIDDIPENTASARILGIETLTLVDSADLRKELQFLGIV